MAKITINLPIDQGAEEMQEFLDTMPISQRRDLASFLRGMIFGSIAYSAKIEKLKREERKEYAQGLPINI